MRLYHQSESKSFNHANEALIMKEYARMIHVAKQN